MEICLLKLKFDSCAISIENNIWELDEETNEIILKTGTFYSKEEALIFAKPFDEFNQKINSIKISENWGKEVFDLLYSDCELFIKKASQREIRNLKFLQDKDINCPKYIDTLEQNCHNYLITEKIFGKPLAEILPELDDHDFNIVNSNLIDEIDKLRRLHPTFKDKYFKDPVFGELDITSETSMFNSITTNAGNKFVLTKTLCEIAPKDQTIVLSHGDLHAYNIMIKNDLTVYIVDWETMAYLPDYWDIFKIGLFHGSVRLTESIENHYNPSPLSLFCLSNYLDYFKLY